jgi:pyruvate formate lyase activating enzyme
MDISYFIENSLIDFPDRVSSVIFTPACNYSCPACHAKRVISNKSEIKEEDIFSYLESRKKWIEGVVICGGEPTLQNDLPDFAKKLKEKNFSVKLDTNGSNPEMLENLLKNNLIDYAAMDIKAPRELYHQAIGINADIGNIEKSMRILSNSQIKYEFRTTIAPILRNGTGKLEFMTADETGEMAKWIAECTQKSSHPYYLQKFVARGKEEMLDERFSKENLPKEMHETPDSLINEIKIKISKYFPDCKIRN